MEGFEIALLESGISFHKVGKTFCLTIKDKKASEVVKLLQGLSYGYDNNMVTITFASVEPVIKESEESEQNEDLLMLEPHKNYVYLTTILANYDKINGKIYGFEMKITTSKALNELEIKSGDKVANLVVVKDIMYVRYEKTLNTISVENIAKTFETMTRNSYLNLFDIIKIGFKYHVEVEDNTDFKNITIEIPNHNNIIKKNCCIRETTYGNATYWCLNGKYYSRENLFTRLNL